MRRVVAAVAVAAGSMVALLAAENQVKVSPVVTEGRVLTSFSAADAWTIETRELLQIGTLVTFEYFVELRKPSTLWLDSVLARTKITASAKLDTLTGEYTLSRSRDDRGLRSEKRRQETEIRDWLTVVDQFELEPESPLKPNTDYYVQVRLYKYPRRDLTVWSVLPFGGDDANGRMKFTYLR
jgi:hypothetical protein